MAQLSNTVPPETSYEEPYRYSGDERRESFEEEDQRHRSQWRDWLILGAMMLISWSYHAIIFLLQPGLR